MFSFKLCAVGKQYAYKTVLRDITLTFHSGMIHALLGENGAGKSTLAAIISGSLQPDYGDLYCSEKKVVFSSPSEALKQGVAVVHQNPRLSSSLTLWENIILGAEKKTPSGRIDVASELERIGRLAHEWNIELSLRMLLSRADAAQRFYTALLAALYKNPHMLILDEPSAVLDPVQRVLFYRTLVTAAKRGLCIVLITHMIPEAVQYSDTISVLRKGIVIEHLNNAAKNIPIKKIQSALFDKELPFLNKQKKKIGVTRERQALAIQGITVRPVRGIALYDITAQACYGDLTVIYGQKESGLKTLEDIITGMFRGTYYGSVSINERRVNPVTPATLRSLGVSLVPSDRVFRAAHPDISVLEMLVALHDLRRDPFGQTLKQFARDLIEDEHIAVNVDEAVSHLSGGMLQRLVLARELAEQPSILILAEPAKGLDTASELTLWKNVRAVADSGSAVLVLTSDVQYCTPFSDKIYPLVSGTIQYPKAC